MSFPEYEQYDAVGLAGLVQSGEVSPSELLAAAIERVERHNPQLNAVIFKMYERAQARIDAGLPDGPFRGVPFLLKDLIAAYAGVPLTMGSRSMRNFIPPVNSTLVDRQMGAGLLIFGKTNTSEFGMSPVTEPELHGITRNPWNPEKTVAGSSGGSAAAVASGMVPMAHATDGGGSIRMPASATGLFGLKPSRGRTPSGPMLGEVWMGLSVGHAVSRSVRDSALLLDVTQGPEAGDPYAAPTPQRAYRDEVEVDPPSLRVAATAESILGGKTDDECRNAVHDTARLLEEMGHRVSYVEVPIKPQVLMEAYITLAAAETALVIDLTAELTGKKQPAVEDFELPHWILGLVGRKLPADRLAASLLEMRRAGRAMGRLFTEFDVLLSSTLGRVPWHHGDLRPNSVEQGLLEILRRMPVGPALTAAFHQLAGRVIETMPNTPLFNITGQPAMSVPLHTSNDRLPVGVQFAGRYGDEATLFRLAGQLERAHPWFNRYPFSSVPTKTSTDL
jgi:amidase